MIIYGKQPVLHLLEKSPKLIKKIILAKQVDKELFKKFKQFPIELVDFKKAQALAKNGNHQGFFAEIEDFQTVPYKNILNKSKFIVILHSITDIGNIGSIVRTANFLGVDGIIISGINNPKFNLIARTSAGAIFDIPIAHYHNIYDILNELKQQEFKIFGATLNGKDISKIDFSENKRVLILGNEASGLPNRVLKNIDLEITIRGTNNFDSLNVSTASAILIDRMRF